MVPHAGAGDDARVAELHRGAHPAAPAGGQSVDGQDHGGLDLRHQAPHRLGGLHAGGAQHAGAEGRDLPESGELPGHGGEQMPGDQHAVQRQGANGVRRHGGVAQAHHQGGALRRQQGLQLRAHGPDGPLEKVRLPLPEGGEVDGEVAAPGLAQSLLAPVVQDVHPSDGIALQLPLGGFHSHETGGPLRGLLPELPGLQGQVGTFHEQCEPPPKHKI